MEKGTLADDHISNFYLALQMMKVQFDDVACHLFLHTLRNKATTWYRSLLVTSIQTCDKFWKSFLDKFSEYKTTSMLLIKLNMLKCHKEKVKDFNQHVTTTLKKFLMDVALDDFIMIDYYTRALPRDIAIFIKREQILLW